MISPRERDFRGRQLRVYVGLYVRAHLHMLVTKDGQMASSAPPFSAGTESEPILRAGLFSFPFMHKGVMSRRKQMDEKIHHRQYRFSVITIERADQQYDHDLNEREK